MCKNKITKIITGWIKQLPLYFHYVVGVFFIVFLLQVNMWHIWHTLKKYWNIPSSYCSLWWILLLLGALMLKKCVSGIAAYNWTFLSFTLLQVVPLGTNTYDMMLKFGIRETECRLGSGIDPQGCAYRRGFFVVSLNTDLGVDLSIRFLPELFERGKLKLIPDQS